MHPDDSNVGKKSTKWVSSSAEPAGRSWFFGVGICSYLNFYNLNNAVKDVKDVIILLQNLYGLESEQTITLFDEAATRSKIIDQLDILAEKVGPADRLIIYYSGHSFLHPQTKLAYWIPQDAEQMRLAGYIPNSTVRDYIKTIKSLHTLLISDSCFSGSFFVRGASRSITAIDKLEQRRSRWGIASGRQNEEVSDGEPGANSPFAASILEVLGHNRDAILTVARLADQVMEMTRSNYKQLPEGNPLFGVGHDGGQYIFRLSGSESDFWERCLAEHSLAGYNNYLDQFPNGPHVEEALQYIRELQADKQPQATVSTLQGVVPYVSGKPYFRKYLPYVVGILLLIVFAIWLLPFAYKTDSVPIKQDLEKDKKLGKGYELPLIGYSFLGDILTVVIEQGISPYDLRLIRRDTVVYRRKIKKAGAHRIMLTDYRPDPGTYTIQVVDSAESKAIQDIQIGPMTGFPPKAISKIIKLGGKSYRTIRLNGLIWMAQNLDYKIADSWCFENDPANCQKFGRLYTWEAANKACQKVGMRLPSDSEWRAMARQFGGADVDAADGGNFAYLALIEGGASGFDAKFGGYRRPDGFFYPLELDGVYWSATERDAESAWDYAITGYYGGRFNRAYSSKFYANSCRCVLDVPSGGIK